MHEALGPDEMNICIKYELLLNRQEVGSVEGTMYSWEWTGWDVEIGHVW